MSDVFREVSEDLRREQLKQLWQRFGKYVIGAAVLIVVIVAGYEILQSVQARQSAESGARYQAAADLYTAGDLEGAEAAFLAVADDGHGGYKTLALMSVAGIRAELGNITGAVEAFDQVGNDAGTELALQDIARIRAAYLLLDTAPLSEIRQRLEPFTVDGGPYRIVALEMMAVSAIQAEDYDQALEWVIGMAQDPFATQASNARATTLFSYILANRPAPETPAEAAAPAELPPALNPAAAGFAAGVGGAAEPVAPGFNPAAPGFNPVAPGATPAPAPAIPLGNEPVVPLIPGFNPAAN
jgi:hypothetical protein